MLQAMRRNKCNGEQIITRILAKYHEVKIFDNRAQLTNN